MIPAALTCAFVIWLYRSLNGRADATVGGEASAASAVAVDGAGSGEACVAALASRIASLDSRVQQLAKSNSQGGPQS